MNRSLRKRALKILAKHDGVHYASQVRNQLRVGGEQFEELVLELNLEGLVEEPLRRKRGERVALTDEGFLEAN